MAKRNIPTLTMRACDIGTPGVLSELLSQGGDGNHETAGVLLIDAGK